MFVYGAYTGMQTGFDRTSTGFICGVLSDLYGFVSGMLKDIFWTAIGLQFDFYCIILLSGFYRTCYRIVYSASMGLAHGRAIGLLWAFDRTVCRIDTGFLSHFYGNSFGLIWAFLYDFYRIF